MESDTSEICRIIWQEDRSLLEELAHRHLEQRPRNTQLLAILTSSLLSSSDAPWTG